MGSFIFGLIAGIIVGSLFYPMWISLGGMIKKQIGKLTGKAAQKMDEVD